MARILGRRGQSVLAINSDLVAGLPYSAGATRNPRPVLVDAAEKADGRWRLQEGIGPVRAIRRCSTQAPDGVRLLDCGTLADGDLDSFMASVAVFSHVVHRLHEPKTFRDWTLIGDLPAGPAPVAFGWAPYAETFLVIVEPTWQSSLTARRLLRMLRSRPGRTALVVANKVTEADRRRVDRLVEPPFMTVPADPAVADADLAGVALIDYAPSSPAVSAIGAMVQELERWSARRQPASNEADSGRSLNVPAWT